MITATEAVKLANNANNANKLDNKVNLLLSNIYDSIREAAAEGKYSIIYYVDIALVLSCKNAGFFTSQYSRTAVGEYIVAELHKLGYTSVDIEASISGTTLAEIIVGWGDLEDQA